MYREEIALGEKAVAALKRQQAAYEERVTVVATEWNALQAHVETLAARVTGGVDATNPNAAPAAPVEDPFLRRLVRAAGGDEAVVAKKRAREEREGADAGAAKRRGDKPPAADAASASDSDDEDGAARDVGGLDEDATRAVDALRARAASVKSTLAKVLDAVDAANARQTGAAGDDSVSRDLERARARVAALDARAAADAEQLERFREQTTKQRKRNEELGKKLEDSTADVEMLRRQLRMARSDAGQIEGLPPMATAHSAKAAAAVAVSAAAGGGKDAGKDASAAAGASAGAAVLEGAPAAAGGAAAGADAEALSKLQGLVYELEGRLKASTSHLDAASSKCAALEGEARGLRDRLASESAVTSSRPFAALGRGCARRATRARGPARGVRPAARRGRASRGPACVRGARVARHRVRAARGAGGGPGGRRGGARARAPTSARPRRARAARRRRDRQ